MSLLSNNTLAGSSGQGGGGYQIERSLRFNSGDSSNLSKTFASAGNRKTWTWSGWVKRSEISNRQYIFTSGITVASDSSYFRLFFQNDDVFYIGSYSANYIITDAVFRDPSAWYHIVIALDTSNATAADRCIMYVNGVRQSTSGGSAIPQNAEYGINSTESHNIGGDTFFNGYLADVHFIDGQALSASDFGEYDDNNVWQPKLFAGTYSGTFTYDAAISVSATRAGNAYGTAQAIYTDPAPAAIYGDYVSSGASIEIEWATAIAGVTSITFNGGPNGASATFQLFINDVAVTAASEGYGAKSYTISSTNITKFKIVGSDGYGLANLKFNGSTPTGTIGINGTAYGANSFHLDFSDNSSNAALGTDSSGNSNTWTVNNLSAGAAAVDYSGNGQMPGSWNAAPNDAAAGFDGSIAGPDVPYFAGSGAAFTWTPSTPISYSTNVEMYVGNVAGFRYDLNGGGWVTPSTQSWNTIATGSGTITTIKVDRSGSDTYGWHAIRVDGTTLVNSAAVITDALRDSPINGDSENDTGAGNEITGNYATLNPLHKGTNATLSNGNLDLVNTTAWGTTVSTIGVSSGKWYAEVTLTGTLTYPAFGVSTLGLAYTTSYLGQQANSFVWFAYGSAGLYTAGAYANQTGDWVIDSVAGDVIGLALDMDNGTLKYYRNGTLVGGGNAFTGITGTQFFATCGYSQTENWNFGQRAFHTAAPAGYKALCTTNLPDPTIADGSTAFDTALYGGNDTSYTISGLSFSPDLVWSKRRDAAARHALCDTVRGATKDLSSSRTDAERTTSDGLTQFNSDGYVIGADAGEYGWNAAATSSFVNWAWDAGSSNTTIAAGSLNSSLYDQSQTWSNYVTGTAYSGYPITNAFNGDTSTRSLESGSTGHTFTPPSAITVNSSLRVYLQYANSSATNALKVNGTDKSNLITTTGSNLGWLTIPGITSITSLFWGVSPAGAETCSISAIEVDGKLLVDSGVSLANVPSIASTVRANPSAGFSIVSYTGNGVGGATVSHQLNTAPKMIILKDRSSTNSWPVGHDSNGWSSVGFLESANAWGVLSYFNNTAPTSTNFSLSGSAVVNGNGSDYIAYCFAPVEQYSSFGSYAGSGATDQFIWTGFAPAFVLIKASNYTEKWYMYDSARQSYILRANDSDSETSDSGRQVSFVSNGFTLLGADTAMNDTGINYIYATFASHPFKTARAS